MINKFFKFCSDQKFEHNKEQIKTLKLLIEFYKNENFLKKIYNIFFLKSEKNLGFYLYGGVGVGKTMLLNFFFNNLKISKERKHFNEFMIEFHNFRHEYKLKGKNNSINSFVKNLKNKAELIYLDEFQVTNIVDAMILGKLFDNIFKENIKILISSNIKIKDLYKDGLQRDQFVPFINIISNFCKEHELIIDQDYRKLGISKLERFFYPVNDQTTFQVSSILREITKKKDKQFKEVTIKGRKFVIKNYFDGIVRFNFNELCGVPIGAEDYIKISENCSFITIDGVPNFGEENADKQNRFITLIDILYEKKITYYGYSRFQSQ